jgi:hypothetical protein
MEEIILQTEVQMEGRWCDEFLWYRVAQIKTSGIFLWTGQWTFVPLKAEN